VTNSVTSTGTNVFEQFFQLYGPSAGEEGPPRFVREVIGVEPDDWQELVLRDYGRGERRISIRSCHGSGKTAVASWCIIHALVTKYPQKTVATAPSASQLAGALVPEVKHWLRQLPQALQDLFLVKADGIYLAAAPESSFFEARTARADAPEAIQGIHSENVLLIVDEASGVPEPVFEAGVGSMSGHNATTILLGNPTRSSGFFFNTHHRNRGLWKTYHITGVPGTPGHYSPRVSADFVEQVRQSYGEDSNAFRVRALGEFPLVDDDRIIPFELAVAAQERDIVVGAVSSRIWALDVARFGSDSSVLLERTNYAVTWIDKWAGADLMSTAGRVKAKWDETPHERRPSEILVDVIGLGAGVLDRLQELGLPVRGINVAEAASASEQYRNLRTELYFKVREWLASKNCVLPRDKLGHELVAELTLVKYDYSSNGKIQAESKSDIRARGEGSPDIADALALSFASEPATLVHGSRNAWGGHVGWNEPLSRGRSVLI